MHQVEELIRCHLGEKHQLKRKSCHMAECLTEAPIAKRRHVALIVIQVGLKRVQGPSFPQCLLLEQEVSACEASGYLHPPWE